MGFKNLTLVPYDKNLIDMDLLTKKDVEYINAYHQRVIFQKNSLIFITKNKKNYELFLKL